MAALGVSDLLLALAVCVYGIGASLYGVRSGRVEFSESGAPIGVCRWRGS